MGRLSRYYLRKESAALIVKYTGNETWFQWVKISLEKFSLSNFLSFQSLTLLRRHTEYTSRNITETNEVAEHDGDLFRLSEAVKAVDAPHVGESYPSSSYVKKKVLPIDRKR